MIFIFHVCLNLCLQAFRGTPRGVLSSGFQTVSHQRQQMGGEAIETAVGAGPSGGGGHRGCRGVGPSGEALCLGSALFRLICFQYFYIFNIHRKISLEQRLSY